MDLDMKLKFNFNKRNRYKNICSIEGCNNSACGKYCNKHYHQIKRYGNIKTRTRFDKNEIIINDNIAKILLYDNNCNVIDYTIIDAEDINKISKYKISYLNIKVMGRRVYGFNNRFRTTKNTEAIVFENGGFVGNLGLSKKLWKKYIEASYKYRTNTDKMTASYYTHLFGYLNPYYRSAYNVSKRRK